MGSGGRRALLADRHRHVRVFSISRASGASLTQSAIVRYNGWDTKPTGVAPFWQGSGGVLHQFDTAYSIPDIASKTMPGRFTFLDQMVLGVKPGGHAIEGPGLSLEEARSARSMMRKNRLSREARRRARRPCPSERVWQWVLFEKSAVTMSSFARRVGDPNVLTFFTSS